MAENNRENMLDWIDETIPVSRQFDDPYYSRSGGYEESWHTFIKGNNLEQRFSTARSLTIAELGFGTGLNFLTAKKAWDAHAPATAQMYFVSFEQFPMELIDLKKSLSRWSELKVEADALISQWHTQYEMLAYQINNVHLTIYFSDANVRLPQLDIKADAWFLDGFSPAKNPQLWNAGLMQRVFDNTRPEGTFATYTSAGWVRRNLQAAGFTVQRIRGHGNKRQMTIGRKPG